MDLCQPKATTPASLPTSTDPPKQLPTAPTMKTYPLVNSFLSYDISNYLNIIINTVVRAKARLPSSFGSALPCFATGLLAALPPPLAQ